MGLNLVKKSVELTIDEENFIMTFDMRSIVTFKELTGKNFVASTSKLGEFDDELLLGFMGATIRREENPLTPIGKEIYEMDILRLLVDQSWNVINLIVGSMPQGDLKSKSKK